METINYEEFGVKKIPMHEIKKINGGIGPLSLAGALTIAGAIIYLYNNYEDFVQGIKDGYNGEYNYKK